MIKNSLIAVLCVALITVVYFWGPRPTKPVNFTVPTASLEENICEKAATQFGDCEKVLLFDSDSNLVFAESSLGIVPALTNKDFTQFEKFIPMMDFQEFEEEAEDRGPIDWRVANKIREDLSIIYGFAEDDAKTIILTSEGNVQPNKFYVRDNLWVWYTTVEKEKVEVPVEVTVYDENGKIVYGRSVEE
ncbi:hypothetical protein [Fredinandcohnia sp. 179-A 10B2 NHS]|uniref:hypothetical protein n=1 Tax=Fredinandcohnia sp. 179-A 10B2 NHS TaxID=3235176 RepID=UPI0039A11E52